MCAAAAIAVRQQISVCQTFFLSITEKTCFFMVLTSTYFAPNEAERILLQSLGVSVRTAITCEELVFAHIETVKDDQCTLLFNVSSGNRVRVEDVPRLQLRKITSGVFFDVQTLCSVNLALAASFRCGSDKLLDFLWSCTKPIWSILPLCDVKTFVARRLMHRQARVRTVARILMQESSSLLSFFKVMKVLEAQGVPRSYAMVLVDPEKIPVPLNALQCDALLEKKNVLFTVLNLRRVEELRKTSKMNQILDASDSLLVDGVAVVNFQDRNAISNLQQHLCSGQNLGSVRTPAHPIRAFRHIFEAWREVTTKRVQTA